MRTGEQLIRTGLQAGVITTMILLGLPGCGGSGRQDKADATRTDAKPVDRAETLTASAEDAIKRGDRDRAVAELTRAIEINPRLTRAHMSLGDVHRRDNDYASAELSYRRAAEIEPQNFDAQYYDGLMLHVLNRLVEAVRAYLRALAVRPDDFQANLRLAGAYYQLDEMSQALPYAKRSVELSARNGEARFQLGAVYSAMNDHAGAVREYQQAAELMPLTTELLTNLAESLGRLGRYSEMANALHQAIRTEPTAAAWERMGFAHWRQEQYAEAHADFERALKIDPDYYPALNGLGVSFLRQWKESDEKNSAARIEGIKYLRRSVVIKKDQAKVLDLLSRYGN